METVNNSVIVTFEDGHRAYFETYEKLVSRQSVGLKFFWLYKRRRIVVQYTGQMQYRAHSLGPNENEHVFSQVTKGYGRDQVTAYWQAAVSFADDDYIVTVLNTPSEAIRTQSYPAYYITQASLQDLSYVKDELVPFPGEQ